MPHPSHSKEKRKTIKAWQKLQRRAARAKLARKLLLERLATDLALEWTGLSDGFQQHLYVE